MTVQQGHLTLAIALLDSKNAGYGEAETAQQGSRVRGDRCGTTAADNALNSTKALQDEEPGFGEGGPGVTDVEIPLTEVPAP
ncbi:hypothetical protein [Streptomyces sp. NPDC001100]